MAHLSNHHNLPSLKRFLALPKQVIDLTLDTNENGDDDDDDGDDESADNDDDEGDASEVDSRIILSW
jgi:hypothetical protein